VQVNYRMETTVVYTTVLEPDEIHGMQAARFCRAGGPGPAACRCAFLSLFISLRIASGLAQDALSPSPAPRLWPEPGLPPSAEPAGSAPTDRNPAPTVGADFGLSALASPSPMALTYPTSAPAETASGPDVGLGPGRESIWENGVGEGFRSSTASIGLSAGAVGGIAVLGGQQAHDLALVSLDYGHMISRTVGQGHWYRGNTEFRLELFTGAQFSPSSASFVGLTPHLRYNFATGIRWVPFVDIGAGVTATSIGPPDLSGTFEFNLQAGTGIEWFLKDNLALSLEARYLHISCAGIHLPNLGLNGVAGLLGLSYFF